MARMEREGARQVKRQKEAALNAAHEEAERSASHAIDLLEFAGFTAGRLLAFTSAEPVVVQNCCGRETGGSRNGQAGCGSGTERKP